MLTTDIQNLALILAFLLNILLGFIVVWRNKYSFSARAFFAITLAIASWALFRFLLTLHALPSEFNLLIAKFIYVSAGLIASFFVLFSYAFPKERYSLAAKRWFYIFLPSLIITITIFTDKLLIRGVDFENNVPQLRFNLTFYYIYFLYVIGYFIWGFTKLVPRYFGARGIQRAQFVYVIWGSILSSVGGILTNLVLPLFGIFQYFWLGPSLTIIMVVLFTYAIFRHHLLNVRVIATELFTGLMLIVAFADVALADSLSKFLIRLAVFGLILIFGILLIRSTLREIKELERLSQAKTEFLSIASHQLRTPLSANKGYLSMLLGGSFGKIKEKHKKVLRRVYISNERLVRLVDDFLNVSRAEEGRLEYQFEKINIIDMIESAFDELRMEAEDKGLEIIWDKPEQALPLIHGDKLKLRQVIMNLIDNAIKYTPQGLVEISAGIENNFLRIKVSDTGIGLSKNDQQILFQRFSRSRGAKRANTGGSGLGLFLAKKIAEAHQGNIRAESAGRGKGSTFIVELPIKINNEK